MQRAPSNKSAPASQSISRATTPTPDSADTADKTSQVVHRVAVAEIKLSDPTPRLSCRIEPSDSRSGTPFEFPILPDTGATVSVLSKDLAGSYGIKIDPAHNEKLLAADNTAMNVSGCSRIKVQDVWLKVIVSSSLKDELLIGWRDLIRLNVIPPNFPARQERFHSVKMVKT